MATKSPGIYYTEKDNTYYSNPKSAIGTTLAIVGFAKKGPTDKPVEINSWKNFVDTFGEAIEGKYTGLAIKNYLAAGGTVLFKRVADNELAEPSSYIIKNGRDAKAAYAFFKKKGDILAGDAKYAGGKLYNFKINDGTENPNNILIRAPKKGLRFTQQSIVKQIDEQLKKGINASYEGLLGNLIRNEVFSFKLTTSEESDKLFYIKPSIDGSKESFIENLEKRLKKTNAIAEMDVFSDGASSGSGESYSIAGTKTFNFVRDGGKPDPVSIVFSEEDRDLTSIVAKINTAINIADIYAFGVGNKIYFVDLLNETQKLEITASEDNPLFVQVNSGYEGDANFPIYSGHSTDSVYVKTYKETAATLSVSSEGKPMISSVKYDNITGTVIITSSEESVELKNETTKGPTGSFIGKGGLIEQELIVKKQAAISGIKTYIDSDKQIRLEFEDKSKKTIKIEKVPSAGVLSETNLKVFDFVEVMEGSDNKENVLRVEDNSKDLVIITSKELGSGTTDISVETSAIVNPLNEEDVSRKITVYVNGILKETFKDEDIEFAYNSEKRFDKVINKDPENGGSYYINVKIVRNNKNSPDVDIPLNGYWKIGQQNKEDDKMFDGVNEDYYSYDYSVGNDGIPEDGGDYLFLEELDAIESDLANKDLYDYHILQTPDNNSSAVQDARIKLCETRGDAFTIIDPPSNLTKKEVIDWHNGIGRDAPVDSNYAAVYWPWCKVFDATSGKGKYAWVMPSIVMAPQYARVDRTVGSQAAPAGENNGVLPVIDIERYPNSTDRDELYVNYNRINPLVKFKDGTVLAYGEKTTQRRESVLTKIHTRRMLIQIKKQCRAALKGYLFEPNTSDYLGKISNNITAILEGYKSNGGLNFYKVVCDETNNPVETRQQDIINVDVALVPQGTIEQININLTLNKSEETVSD